MQDLLAPVSVGCDERWGLDHGSWTVLRHVYPKADVPVVQLSIDNTQPPSFHYELAKKLGSLRDEGVLIVGSGNIVHNLRAYSWNRSDVEPLSWAVRFDSHVRKLLIAGKEEQLIEYRNLGQDALLSAPTPDHYLPLLYIIGLRRDGESVSFPVEGFDGGSMSMLSVQIG
jgi:4,5-DOPA dioxygenase extradiol